MKCCCVRRHSRRSERKVSVVPESSLYTFKGRIPLSQIELENIEDGTGKATD